MKKLLLTSLFVVFIIFSVNAANVINGGALYMPAEGHFYSITSVDSNTKYLNDWNINEDFGYGITDDLEIYISTNIFEKDTFNNFSWNNFSLGFLYVVLKKYGWSADIYGSYSVQSVWADHKSFFNKDCTFYKWMVGIGTEYATYTWNIAGYLSFNYFTGGKVIDYQLKGSESFNFGDNGMHTITAGVSVQYLLSNKWNLVSNLEYEGVLDGHWYDSDLKEKNAGYWYGELGVNYNIDETKYVGVFASENMNHSDGWTSGKGVGFGVRFGIDF